jgi:hypothetical protein
LPSWHQTMRRLFRAHSSGLTAAGWITCEADLIGLTFEFMPPWFQLIDNLWRVF